MMEQELKKPKLLISEILIIIDLICVFCFLGISWVQRGGASDLVITILYSICTFCFAAFFGFTLFIENRYNRLSLNNIFLYLGIAIFLINFIAIIIEPLHINLPYGASLDISPTIKVYYLLCGFPYGALPFILFVLVPRRILSNHYFDIMLKIVAIGVLVSILLSFILEFEFYNYLFRGDIDYVLGHDIKSIFTHKNVFGRYLFIGIVAILLLHIRKNKWYWLLLLMPFYLILLLTGAKITIVITTFALLVYLIVRIVILSIRNRDNYIIALLVSGFILFVGILLFVFSFSTQTGLLHSINKAFTSLLNGAKNTFSSRLIIWEDSFKLLSPHQYICGFGINCFQEAIHATYSLDPRLPSWEDLNFIYHAHNYFIGLIGSGGILLLLIYLFINFYVIYLAIKVIKNKPLMISMCLLFLFCYLVEGIVEFNGIGLTNEDIVISIVLTSPVIFEYYKQNKVNELHINDLVNIDLDSPNNLIEKISYGRIAVSRKYILKELE